MRETLIFILVVLLTLPACKNNHVVNSTLGIQKRKYTKGYHVNLGKRTKQATLPVNKASGTQQETTATTEFISSKTEKQDNTSGLVASTENAIGSETLEGKHAPTIEHSNTPVARSKPWRYHKEESTSQANGQTATPHPEYEYKRTSGSAIAGFVLGICAVVLPPFGLILGPLAIVFSSMGKHDVWNDPENIKGQGLASAGLILGIIGTLFSLLYLAYVILLFSAIFWW